MYEVKKFNGKQLAELLNVAAPSLSGAAKKDHLCKGQPVARWAQKNERGKVLGYEVPLSKISELENSGNKANSGSESFKQPNQEPNQLEEPTNEPKEVEPIEANKPIRENNESEDSGSVVDALIFAGLGFGVLWTIGYMQKENEALKSQIWASASKANSRNKANKTSKFVNTNFLPR